MSLHNEIIYDPETGLFRWRRLLPGRKLKIGTKTKMGYVHIRVNYTIYLAHRLAWYLTYGKWPFEIDHINGVKDDNRLVNLREVTHSMNMLNQKRHRHEPSSA